MTWWPVRRPFLAAEESTAMAPTVPPWILIPSLVVRVRVPGDQKVRKQLFGVSNFRDQRMRMLDLPA